MLASPDEQDPQAGSPPPTIPQNDTFKNLTLEECKTRILTEERSFSSFVVIGGALHSIYYENHLIKNQREFLDWTKANLGFSKSTTYEYIISYRVYRDIAAKLPTGFFPPVYQSHCQLLSRVPSEFLVETWMDICKCAPNGTVTTLYLEDYLEAKNLLGKCGKDDRRRRRRRSLDDEELELYQREESPGHSGFEVCDPLGHWLSDPTPTFHLSTLVGSSLKNEPSSRRSLATHPPAIITTNSNPIFNFPSSAAGHLTSSSSSSLPTLCSPLDISAGMATAFTHPQSAASLSAQASSSNLSLHFRVPIAPPRPSFIDAPDARWLPFDTRLIFELGRAVVPGGEFDLIHNTLERLDALCGDVGQQQHQQSQWYGRVWINLTSLRPLSTFPEGVSDGGLELMLQVIFTKYANKEFVEGLFLIRAEFGADWFTPILQHPHCILRHNWASLSPSPSVEFNKSEPPNLKRQKRSPDIPSRMLQSQDSFVVFYLGSAVQDFCSVYRSVGLVPGVNSWYGNLYHFKRLVADKRSRCSSTTYMNNLSNLSLAVLTDPLRASPLVSPITPPLLSHYQIANPHVHNQHLLHQPVMGAATAKTHPGDFAHSSLTLLSYACNTGPALTFPCKVPVVPNQSSDSFGFV
ncbi:hypothetical protein BJ742DRAFT_893215 [Cladochytrium replicatum]|nr:hypothetical protein BJ742DRAFT_893215 [Cladochytrium replicatum]